MKYRVVLVLLASLCCALVVSAQVKPTSKVDFADPLSVTKAFFSALEDGRYDDLSPLFEESVREELGQLDPSFELAEALGIPSDEADSLAGVYKITFVGLSIEKPVISGSKATVHAKGSMRLSVDMDIMRSVLERMFSDMEDMGPSEIEMILSLISEAAQQESEIDDDVSLVKVGAKWLIAEGL